MKKTITTMLTILLPSVSQADQFGIKNCTGITGPAYTLSLSVATGPFENAPPLLKSKQIATFQLSSSGELNYKGEDGSYLDVKFNIDPYSMHYSYSWQKVWYQSISPMACGFSSISDDCYAALNYPDDPPECSSPP